MTVAIPEWRDALPARQRLSIITNVVLPLDGTPLSRVALPVARGLCQLYGATMHVLYVGEEQLAPEEAVKRLGLTPQETQGAVLDQYSDDPADMILRAAERLAESAIVMCTHTGRHNDGESFGSVTESVLRAVPKRIVLLRPECSDPGWKLRRILLAHDGTPCSDVASSPAAELARRAGAEALALHVAARSSTNPEEPGSLPAPRYVDQPQHEWPNWAHEFMGRMLALGALPSSMHFKLVVTGGQPGSEVAQVSRERNVDLVVMAWRGDWKEQPTAPRIVIRNAGCPVMLVHSLGD